MTCVLLIGSFCQEGIFRLYKLMPEYSGTGFLNLLGQLGENIFPKYFFTKNFKLLHGSTKHNTSSSPCQMPDTLDHTVLYYHSVIM